MNFAVYIVNIHTRTVTLKLHLLTSKSSAMSNSGYKVHSTEYCIAEIPASLARAWKWPFFSNSTAGESNSTIFPASRTITLWKTRERDYVDMLAAKIRILITAWSVPSRCSLRYKLTMVATFSVCKNIWVTHILPMVDIWHHHCVLCHN